MFSWLKGWTGFFVVVVAAGLAEASSSIPLLRKVLWSVAALAAVVIGYDAWKS